MATLSEYLKAQQLTQADFAGRIGVTQGYIAKLCASRATPTLQTAHKIEIATSGAVPVATWLTDAAPVQGQAS